MPRKILILEDDKLFNETLQDFLEEEGYTFRSARNPYTAYEMTYAENFDLYLLDVNLPYESGFDLLGKLRESGDDTPAIFLTSREDKASLAEGFGVGADDYLRKPVDLDELLLRIEAVLRRRVRSSSVTLGRYHLDTVTKELYLEDKRIEITRKSVELLLLLLESDGMVVSSDTIKRRLWSANQQSSDGSLRVYIAQLKKHFPDAITNIRGIGYRFDREKAEA